MNAGYRVRVHETSTRTSRTVAWAYNGDVVALNCWHDGGWANVNYFTNRWFQVTVPHHYTPITGWLTASVIKRSEQPRLPKCIKVTYILGDGSQYTDWEAPPPRPTSPGSPSAPTQPGGTSSSPGASPSISASQGGQYGCAGCHTLDIQVHDFATGTYTYYCHDNSGPGGSDTMFFSHAVVVNDPNQSSWPGVFCYDSAPYVAYLVMGGVQSNSVAFGEGSPPPPLPPPPPATYAETTGGVTHTWTNYLNAGGTQGPSVPSHATVQIACKLGGFRVADGDTWWYRIASSPWNSAFYASADAFYNNGQTSGSLAGTPFVDPNVADC